VVFDAASTSRAEILGVLGSILAVHADAKYFEGGNMGYFCGQKYKDNALKLQSTLRSALSSHRQLCTWILDMLTLEVLKGSKA
jgi:hypothetical protein